jgi:DNA topoisomerase I
MGGRPGLPEVFAVTGLRYVNDAEPGITRRRAGRGFAYRRPDGTLVRDRATLRRIRALAIPPAYTDVWICPDPMGHIQATGRDARGRKQYRYHPEWHAARDALKYDHLLTFGSVLPTIRQRTDRDLAARDLTREKVLALVVRLLETSLIRVGNEVYQRENGSFGLTTLRNEHVEVVGSTIRFQFRGKSGKEHAIRLTDRRLARAIRRCQELPGQELFQYIDEAGERRTVTSADVNAYLREISGEEVTAKDFRTWGGSLLALRALRDDQPPPTLTERRRAITRMVKAVATRLGNTATICRRCYIHPAILDAYLAVGLTVPRPTAPEAAPRDGLTPDEEDLVAFLARAAEAPASAA